MSTLDQIHKTIVVGLGNLLYTLRLYTPYYTNMLYYPYRRHQDYWQGQFLHLTDEQWLNSQYNHELGHFCNEIVKHPNGTFTCVGCHSRQDTLFSWPSNRKVEVNKWTIPKITLSNDRHDTKAVYYVLPWQMYLICEGKIGYMFEPRFFYNSAPEMNVLTEEQRKRAEEREKAEFCSQSPSHT
jgi:hypothetical protein